MSTAFLYYETEGVSYCINDDEKERDKQVRRFTTVVLIAAWAPHLYIFLYMFCLLGHAPVIHIHDEGWCSVISVNSSHVYFFLSKQQSILLLLHTYYYNTTTAVSKGKMDVY